MMSSRDAMNNAEKASPTMLTKVMENGRAALSLALQGMIFTATCGAYHFMIFTRESEMRMKIEEERRAAEKDRRAAEKERNGLASKLEEERRSLALETHKRAWAEAYIDLQRQVDANSKRWWWQRQPIVFNVPMPPLPM